MLGLLSWMNYVGSRHDFALISLFATSFMPLTPAHALQAVALSPPGRITRIDGHSKTAASLLRAITLSDIEFD